ncbi:MAG TPA: hypothetical protein VHE83_01660, partial [Mycobacteriales bacterium]|nr:hypothetical protein [Mycobacteriales bacterium]
GKPGRTYSVAVAAIDNAGHLNVNVADTDVTLPFDDKANQLSKAWSHKTNGKAYASTVSVASKKGTLAKLTVQGTVVGILVDYGPKNGILQLKVDGKVVKTIDTGGTTRWAVPVTVTRKAGKHVVTVTVLGTHKHGSTAQVLLDGFIAH